MCYSTSLDRDLKALERAMHKKMLEESKRVDLPYQVELPLGVTSAFARPAWPVVTTAAPEHISVLRWGLLPRYIRTEEEAKDFLKKAPTFNAISEEVDAKRTFKGAFEHGQRCLIPVTSFQEWRHEGKVKIPYRIGLKDTEIFCLGGLWEKGDTMDTYTVLTTRANPLMAHIHNTKQRQPVIIPPEHYEAWLSPDLSPEQVKALCEPIAEERMESVRKEAPPAQGSLF
ncbi:MAG: SOS response-associated peptidase [Flavobacteriales bacterium]|nr:SOS response-associated peptidase [Flavobacteriales bacterium]